MHGYCHTLALGLWHVEKLLDSARGAGGETARRTAVVGMQKSSQDQGSAKDTGCRDVRWLGRRNEGNQGEVSPRCQRRYAAVKAGLSVRATWEAPSMPLGPAHQRQKQFYPFKHLKCEHQRTSNCLEAQSESVMSERGFCSNIGLLLLAFIATRAVFLGSTPSHLMMWQSPCLHCPTKASSHFFGTEEAVC